jgi:hypothetical protein
VKKLVFFLLQVGLTLLICLGVLYVSWPAIEQRLRPLLLDYMMVRMSDEQRQEIYAEIANRTPGQWETVPEPLVARLGKRGRVAVLAGARVSFNNAGMRSSRPYTPKPPNVFRIICLGDSFVFGQAGKEQDRFCHQMESFYKGSGITMGGKTIETYAVGLNSWTAVQEATYLTSRISDYDPDVIVVLTVPNDITDMDGVTGAGVQTGLFSPEHRNWGSAVFNNYIPVLFGALLGANALDSDLVPEARDRWTKAMLAMKRLTELQHRRGKKILHTVMNLPNPYFVEIYKKTFRKLEIDAPFTVMNYFPTPALRLSHNTHPNRKGHAIMAAYFLRVLKRLGWVPVPDELLPGLVEWQTVEMNPSANPVELRRQQTKFVDAFLRTSLDFANLHPGETRGFLGGIRPVRAGMRALDESPWGGVRSGFLLKRPLQGGANAIEVEIQIPDRVELFPFVIDLYVNGSSVKRFAFPKPQESGRYRLVGDLPPLSDEDLAVEVILETNSYFTEIVDSKMKSFRFISARVF